MDSNELKSAIEDLQNHYNNMRVGLAVPAGVMLILYFFSFATLIDRGMTGLLSFQIVSSIVFVAMLIFVNPMAFALLRWRYGRKADYRQLFPVLSTKKLSQDAEQLTRQLNNAQSTDS